MQLLRSLGNSSDLLVRERVPANTHTKFFWALNIPDSKVKQRTKNQKIIHFNLRTDAVSLLAMGELLPPTTFPSTLRI